MLLLQKPDSVNIISTREADYAHHSTTVLTMLKYIPAALERRYICETSSFGRKVRRRKAVLLLGFSDSVADYEETKGF